MKLIKFYAADTPRYKIMMDNGEMFFDSDSRISSYLSISKCIETFKNSKPLSTNLIKMPQEEIIMEFEHVDEVIKKFPEEFV